MNFLNNAWVIGIGGGVLSGFFVTVFSRMILSRRDRGEYVQKLQSANREIIYALRPGISEGHVPNRQVVVLLINATARKYGVDIGDLVDPAQIGEELTKEIMGSSFISASTKQEYCDQLTPLTSAPPEVTANTADASEERSRSRSDFAAYRARMVTSLSAMLGGTTAMMTMILVISDGAGRSIEALEVLLPSVAALLSTIMVAILMMRSRRGRTRSKIEDRISKISSMQKSKNDDAEA